MTGSVDGTVAAAFGNAAGIDVFGDVHGHGGRLSRLLHDMGYRLERGAFRHPERKAAFVGDLVDRGPDQLGAIDAVRRMVGEGEAICVMGNHELNSIGYATRGGKNGWLRNRGPKNAHQCSAFIDAVGLDTPLHKDVVGWFTTLPLWAEVAGLRFVHACWHPASVAQLPGGRIDADDIPRFFEYDEQDMPINVTRAVENLAKGPEVDLPDGISFLDPYGIERHRTRIAWWRSSAANLGEMALLDGAAPQALLDLPPAAEWLPAPGSPITFIGHYWLEGAPRLVSDRVVCVDFSVAKGGFMAAYRWNRGETEPSAAGFVWN